MKKLIFIIIVSLTLQVQGQQFYTELYGFKLGQYRNATKKELGKPFRYEKFKDGFIYEAFFLKPDSSLYVIFEYSNIDTNVIWSIQVSGENNQTDIGFKNAKLGFDKLQTEKCFGKPSTIEYIGEYGKKWVYNKTNFSIELSTKEKLSSVKIIDNSDELYPNSDIKKMPTLDKIRIAFNSNNNAEILALLCGNIEIYYKGETYSIERSFKTELETDYSKIISLIRLISKDLSTIDISKNDDYSESMRVVLGEDVKHVMKFKKKHIIKEIVFRYFGGQYLIYEINADID
jgi:hypothetical protein